MKKRSLKINSALNVIRQISAVLFPIITIPYATKILGTTNYGKVAFGQSVISYMSILACLGSIEYAVREGARVRQDKQSFQKLADQIFSINVFSTGFAFLLLFILILKVPGFRAYTLLLIVQSLCMLFNMLGTDWINMAYEDYFYISIRYIACHVISLLLLFIIVKSSDDYIKYAFTCVLTDILAGTANIIYVRKKYDIHPSFTFDIDVKKHMIPIMVLFGSTLASFVYINSDVIMLGILKDEDAVGIYSAAAKIYIAVKQIINAALTVAIPRITGNIKEGIDNKNLLKKIRTASLLFLLPACAGLYTISDKIIYVMCGQAYAEAGTILKILAVALFFASSGAFYISVVMIPYKKERQVLEGTIIAAAINIVLNFFLIPLFGFYAAAFTTVISEAVMTVTGVICTRNILTMRLIKPYIISFLNISFIVAVSYMVNLFEATVPIQLILTVAISVAGVSLICFISYHKQIRAYKMST